MLFSVPQNIDVEDKIAGPLTAKQLGWMMSMVAILVMMWLSISNRIIFFIFAMPLVMVFVALAFVRPYGQTMISLAIAGVRFLFGPKVYIWRRVPRILKKESKQSQAVSENVQISENRDERKKELLQNIKGIAKMIDSRGSDANQDVISVLKKPETGK